MQVEQSDFSERPIGVEAASSACCPVVGWRPLKESPQPEFPRRITRPPYRVGPIFQAFMSSEAFRVTDLLVDAFLRLMECSPQPAGPEKYPLLGSCSR